jgi:serine/threonine protein kinase
MNEVRLAPGLQIGEYVLEARLGAGGMGEVWRACQPMIETTVAIKILTFEAAARKSQLERFLREARAVNRVQHRNLAKIFSFGELADGRPYFVMEFLAGDNLRDFLRKSGTLPFATIYHVIEQVCRTLQAAHEAGVVHRDLKPENIFLVTEPGSLPFVKVLDFGVAKLADKDPLAKREHPTQTGATLGTPGYMSPEQYENSKMVDERADIYSMGVILFELITNQHPFDAAGETAYVVIAKQLSIDPPIASSMIPERSIPTELDAFIARTLSRKPETRPRDCKEFLLSFQKALGDLKLEKEIPTHANEPTQIKASYDQIRAKKVLPEMPTPTAQVRMDDVLFSDESLKEGTQPAIQIEPSLLEVEEERVNTQLTPPPVSSKAKAKQEDEPTITGAAAPAKRPPTPGKHNNIVISEELATQKFSNAAIELNVAKKNQSEIMRTTPDGEMPELIKELLAKRAPPKEREREENDERFLISEAPTAANQIVAVNTPEPISVPTTSPGKKLDSTKMLVGAGTGVFFLVLLGWFFFFSSEAPKKNFTPSTTPTPISTSIPASVSVAPIIPKAVATAPTPTPVSQPKEPQEPTEVKEVKEPKDDSKEDAKKAALCKKDKETAKDLIIASKFAQALAALATAQEKCPKDPEVQRLFGYTYEQKGDIGFACIRYNKALSFGLSGQIANKTKKIMNELNCQ